MAPPDTQPAPPPGLVAAREALRLHFGHADFRPGQDEAVARVLEGEDLTIVMPTGAGKSACYQVPALVRGGLTLVVSPLIALMKDQVEGLRARGIAAELVNSTIPAQEQWRRLERAADGETRLLYVAPERLTAPSFLRSMERAPLNLVAVDEAHCISQWGHDFRPAYLGIQAFLARLAKERGSRPQVLALTATATPRVRSDIAAQLGLDARRALITGFRRPNLRLLARRCDRKADRAEQVARIVLGVKGSGIVYCSTRRDVEEVSAELSTAGVTLCSYHAGMEDAARARAQEAFLSGDTPVIVATNAFGMGIDKPDIRFVIHHSLPGSIEAYYQEAGRAGRDGKTAYCVLVFGAGDRHLHEFFIEGSCPDDESVLAAWRALATRQDVVELSLDALASLAGIPEIQAGGSLKTLEDAGLVERLDDRDNPAQVRFTRAPREAVEACPEKTQRRAVAAWLVERFSPALGEVVALRPGLAEADLGLPRETLLRVLRELAEAGLVEFRPPFRGRGIVVSKPGLKLAAVRQALAPHFAATAARRQRSLERLDRVAHFAYSKGCRHAFLLRYFGDDAPESCRACDNCCGWHEKESAQATLVPSAPKARRGAASRPRRELPDLDEVRPVALRAVADLRKRFGLGMATLVLRGSRSQKIVKARLDASAAYSALARLREEDVDVILESLVTEGLVETSTGPYPVAFLTEEGRMRLEQFAR